MKQVFTAVFTAYVEIPKNETIVLDELGEALEKSVMIDLITDDSENTFGKNGKVTGCNVDWSKLTPARKPSIQVWRYEDAPDELKYKSPHGGDEDWVALVPKELVTPDPENLWIPWLEESHFGNNVSQQTLEDGSVLFISAH